MKVRCPAKINLYLRILGKRPDGFHELETLMCPVSIFDEMEFENGPADVELQIEGADIPAGEDNLVVRAVRLLQEATGLRNGVRIRLRKQIPVGGGLAGGSSNAALTLRALNTFWKAGLSEAQLGQAAAKLGSDINFFLQDGPAICRGRGELVEPVELAGEWQALLINPGFGVPTPWVRRAGSCCARRAGTASNGSSVCATTWSRRFFQNIFGLKRRGAGWERSPAWGMP